MFVYMCMCIYVNSVYICVYVYMCVYVSVSVCVVYMYICIYVYTCICICVYMWMCVYMCNVYMYICIYMYICVYIYRYQEYISIWRKKINSFSPSSLLTPAPKAPLAFSVFFRRCSCPSHQRWLQPHTGVHLHALK